MVPEGRCGQHWQVIKAGTWRALSPSENIQAVREAYIGYAVRAAGRLDLDALAVAYRAVCQAYPQLAARLEVGDGGTVFTESDERPELRVVEGDLDRPLTGVVLDQSRATSVLNVVRAGGEATVCLATHHGIADAAHSVEILAALWSYYTDTVDGVPVDPVRHSFPRSLEELLAERGIHATATAPKPADVPDRSMPVQARHVVQHQLTTAETTALRELGHREQVTINGLLSGALLLAEADFRGLPLTDLVYRYTVNLRSHLSPAVGATEGTNILGGAGFKATEDVAPDAVSIGRAVGAARQAGLADGSIQRSLLDMLARPARDAKPWDPNNMPAVVSMINWGVLPAMRTPEGLALTNFRSSSSIREAIAPGGYVVHTFDGRIGIDFAWPEDDAELPKRFEHVREQLSRVTRLP